MDEIKVTVVEFGDRKCYQMQYKDPITGRKKTRSTEVERTGRKKERDVAERAAGTWEKQLRDGVYFAPNNITWADFRTKYEDERLTGLAEATDDKAQDVFNSLERIVNPARLRDLNAERLSHYQSKLREKGLAETSIAGYLSYIRAALRWAVEMELLAVAPKIQRPPRAKGSKSMKGRPITTEEFERMLDAVPKVVAVTAKAKAKPNPSRDAHNASIVESWKYYLRGMWASGLRLAESLELWWDRDDKLCVDMSGKRPMLRIPAALEKGNQDRVLPMSPEFAEFLLETPKAERTGPVFNPRSKQCTPRLCSWSVSTIVSNIGKKAGVKVNTDAKTGKVKYASAHDLRRSFGERWASRVMPQILMELMRHESIDTTMRYYVGRNAHATADVLWQAHRAATGNTSGNSQPETSQISEQ